MSCSSNVSLLSQTDLSGIINVVRVIFKLVFFPQEIFCGKTPLPRTRKIEIPYNTRTIWTRDILCKEIESAPMYDEAQAACKVRSADGSRDIAINSVVINVTFPLLNMMNGAHPRVSGRSTEHQGAARALPREAIARLSSVHHLVH